VWEAAERATTLDAQPRTITQLIANA